MENNDQFTGLGYKSSIAEYITRRFEDDIKTTPSKTFKKVSHTEEKRAAKEVRDVQRTVEGEVTYLAIKPFYEARGTPDRGSSSSPDSLYVDEDAYAIVDTGTTITITNLQDQTEFESFDEKARANIVGFNGATSRSKGSGTIVGYTTSTRGKTVVIQIPNAHQVDGAPHELVSVSNMVKHGYEFHFTVEESYVVSPGRDKIMLIEKGGLYWLKMKRAVGPAASTGLARKLRGESVEPNINEFIHDKYEEDKKSFAKCKLDNCEQCNLTLRAEGRTVPLRLMHQRLNHMSEELIVKMSKLGALDVNVIGKKTVCDVCRTAKAHRSSVPKRRELLDDQLKPFQRVWTDLKGKVTKDIWSNQYIITFTCEATRWTWVGFMKRKSEAKDQYLKFLQVGQARGAQGRPAEQRFGGRVHGVRERQGHLRLPEAQRGVGREAELHLRPHA